MLDVNKPGNQNNPTVFKRFKIPTHYQRRLLTLGGIIIAVTTMMLVWNRTVKTENNVEESQFLLDTVVSIKLFDSSDKTILDDAFKKIAEYEYELSRYHSESDVSRINQSDAGIAVAVSANTISVLHSSLSYAQLSNGRFDPTVGALVDLWGIGGDSPGIPDTDELEQALRSVDYRLIQVDNNSVTRLKDGIVLDIGGIAKGWIADEIADFLKKQGVKHALLNLGGNIRLIGGKPGGEAFKIGIQDPFSERGNYLGIISIEEGSVVSSGIYERFFDHDGVRYHHILDTQNGYPVDNGLASVTVISRNSVDGDALSTSLFALGMQEGMKLAESLKNIEAVFISKDKSIQLTEGAKPLFNSSRTSSQ